MALNETFLPANKQTESQHSSDSQAPSPAQPREGGSEKNHSSHQNPNPRRPWRRDPSRPGSDGNQHNGNKIETQAEAQHENSEHRQSDKPHHNSPNTDSKKSKGKKQKSGQRKGAYKLPTIVTYAVPSNNDTSNRHMPFDALTDEQKARRQAVINTIMKHWNHDPNTWLPQKHRPDNMPEDPKDWSGTYLRRLAKLAENTTGDVDRAQEFLESAARHYRKCLNGNLSGDEIDYAVDLCLQSIGAEEEREAARAKGRAHQEADQDSEHEASAVHKPPMSFAGFNANFTFSAPETSRANRQEDVDMTREELEETQEERIRQTSSAFASLKELADSLPSSSQNTTFPSFGAADHTMSTIHGSNMVNTFHGQASTGNMHTSSAKQRPTHMQRTMTSIFGQPSRPLHAHVPPNALSTIPFRKYSDEASIFTRVPSLQTFTTAPWSAPIQPALMSTFISGRHPSENDPQIQVIGKDHLNVEESSVRPELQQQECFEQYRQNYREHREQDDDEDMED